MYQNVSEKLSIKHYIFFELLVLNKGQQHFEEFKADNCSLISEVKF